MNHSLIEGFCLDEQTKLRIGQITTHSTANFCELTKVAELDPTTDFRFTNLRGVDFSNCDLSGFDFTGADLRESFGVSVEVNASTILRDADIAGTFFEYKYEREMFLFENSDWSLQFSRLLDAHFTTSVVWLADNLKTTMKTNQGPWYVATKLLEKTQDPVLRSNILFFARPIFSKSSEHLSFLLHFLAGGSVDAKLKKSVISALSAFYANHRTTFSTLMRLLSEPERAIRQECLKGLANSSYMIENLTNIIQRLSEHPDPEFRRYLLRRVCRRLDGPDITAHQLAARDPQKYSQNSYLDYAEPINERLISSIAKKWLIYESAAKHVDSKRASPLDAMSFEPDPKTVERKAFTVRAVLSNLQKHGVPFAIQDDLRKTS